MNNGLIMFDILIFFAFASSEDYTSVPVRFKAFTSSSPRKKFSLCFPQAQTKKGNKKRQKMTNQ